VEGLTTASRRRTVARHNRKRNIDAANFEIDDFALVRTAMQRGHKLHFKRQGPQRVAEIKKEWVCAREDLLTNKRMTAHKRYLHLSRAEMDGKEVVPALLRAVKHAEARYETAHAVTDIRARNDVIEVQVAWDGLPDETDCTWEPILQVFEDL